MGRVIRWVAVWFAHVGLWLIFVSQLSTWEVLVGAAAAALATLGVYVFGRLKLVQCRPSLRELAEVWRTPGYALADTGKVFQAIGQQLFSKRGPRSALAAVPFDYGRQDAAAAGRRALAALFPRSLGRAGLGKAGSLLKQGMRPLRAIHSGRIGDYMAWFALGMALYCGILVLLG